MKNIDSNFNGNVNLFVNEEKGKMCAPACLSWCDEGFGSSGACSHCRAEISTKVPVVPPMTIHPRPRKRTAVLVWSCCGGPSFVTK